MKYQVVDARTKAVIGTYQTFRRALNKADKMDLAFGAVRYSVIKLES